MKVQQLIEENYSKTWVNRILNKIESHGISRLEELTETVLYKIGLICDKLKKKILSGVYNELQEALRTNQTARATNVDPQQLAETDSAYKGLPQTNSISAEETICPERKEYKPYSPQPLRTSDQIIGRSSSEIRESVRQHREKAERHRKNAEQHGENAERHRRNAEQHRRNIADLERCIRRIDDRLQGLSGGYSETTRDYQLLDEETIDVTYTLE